MRLCYLVFFLLPLLISCESKKPIAKIKFLGIEGSGMNYAIAFSSDIDLDALYSEAQGEAVASRNLICALGDDQNFSVEHFMRRSFAGKFERLYDSSKGKPGEFHYVSRGYFDETDSKGSLRKPIRTAEINELASARPSIPCKVVMTVYLSRAYYSESMQIPSSAIINSSKG